MAFIPVPILGSVQSYHWGRPRQSSIIAKFDGIDPKNDLLAEIWFGTHPKSPSTFRIGGTSRPLTEWGSDGELALPFLLKVLSINEPLSIQIHPEVTLAKKLHQKYPNLYPDSNRKVELAFALSRAEVLWGLRSETDLEALLASLNLSEQGTRRTDRASDFIIKLICNSSPNQIEEFTRSLMNSNFGKNDKRRCELASWIVDHYGIHDRGTLWSYALNLITLEPGEVLVTNCGIIHAYLNGEMVELMTTSDNVIRGGLTQKICDLVSFQELAISEYFAPKIKSEPKCSTSGVKYSETILPGEKISLVHLPSGGSLTFEKNNTPRIAIALHGSGKVRLTSGEVVNLLNGGALLIPATAESYMIESISGDLFIAGENL